MAQLSWMKPPTVSELVFLLRGSMKETVSGAVRTPKRSSSVKRVPSDDSL